MTSTDSSRSVQANGRRQTALVIWAWPKRGVHSVGRALAGMLAANPHNLQVAQVDLAEELTGQSLIHSLAAWTGMKLENKVLTARGWPVVEQRLASKGSPRVVAALDPAAAIAVDCWRREGHLRAPLVGVTLGLRLDPAWARTAVDRLAVADERQAKVAAELGLPPECVVPSGIPVCAGFSSVPPDDKEPLRRHFGLPEKGPVVLVVTDGLEPDELTGVLFQLSLVAERATIMFDVAEDDDAADLLRRRAGVYGVEARMFGKVEEAGQLWAAADLVVAKTLIYVEQRALALRLPYVHLLPADQLERETAREYVDRGVGGVVEHISTLAAEVDMLLGREVLSETRQRMGAISKRTAAVDVARMVAQVAAQADQILKDGYRQVGPVVAARPGTPETDEPPAAKGGPLETIGSAGGAAGSRPEAEDPAALLSDLDAAEAETNRQVSEHQKEVDLWNRRVALAREKGEEDLAREAQKLAERHLADMHRALAELGRISERRRNLDQKQKRTSRVERDFQRLEVEDALTELKRKLGRED